MSKQIVVVFWAAALGLSTAAALADAISPSIKDDGSVYSEADPNSAMYGTGPGAELTEASALRFEGSQRLRHRKYDEAIGMFLKAVQFDPGDPESHLLLARAMTAKIMHGKKLPEGKALKEAIDEWKLIWHHDADQTEQQEAKVQARLLQKLAKAIEKDKLHDLNTHGEVLSKSSKSSEFDLSSKSSNFDM